MGLGNFFKNLFGSKKPETNHAEFYDCSITKEAINDFAVDSPKPNEIGSSINLNTGGGIPTQIGGQGQEKTKPKTNKTIQVKEHLLKHGEIHTWLAIQKYGATRLSDIIYRLKNSGMNIETIMNTQLDRNGQTCNYATYKLITPDTEVSDKN